MEALIRLRSVGTRGKAHLLLAVAFLFFVLYSAPHRVHHFFEQTPLALANNVGGPDADNSAHEAGHSHGGVPKAPRTNSADCAVLSLAQNAHAFTPPLLALSLQVIACAHVGDLTVFSADSFNPSPFSQRAPPLA